MYTAQGISELQARLLEKEWTKLTVEEYRRLSFMSYLLETGRLVAGRD